MTYFYLRDFSVSYPYMLAAVKVHHFWNLIEPLSTDQRSTFLPDQTSFLSTDSWWWGGHHQIMHWSTLSFEAHNSLTKGKKLYVSSSARQSDASKKTGCIVVDDHNYPQKVSVINSAHDNNQSHHVSCSCVLSTPPYTNRPFIANTTKYIPIYKMKWCRCCQQNRSSATVPLAPLPSLAFAIFFLQHKSSNSHDIHREFW